MDEIIARLIKNHGFKQVIGALARYAYTPADQHYKASVMATCARRLNAIFEYLAEKE